MQSRSAASDSKKALDELVKKLVEARKRAQITQAEMARSLEKAHQSAISKIESGEHELRLADFVRWSRAVGQDPCELLREFEENLEQTKKKRVRVQLRKREV